MPHDSADGSEVKPLDIGASAALAHKAREAA
jgi:hypothetical protein